ncbi:hypothetical protein GCM10010913_21100 [Paenibacillus aceti]|uniref:Uncharacterized protein n=1 Tax=Paenibacillus aceti TaxID=1820010 RepID=A0ABQ1VU46_9BACL|nr:hypothetical protein GCM10010913_21100 [Paenibacillus aceti]
MELDTSKLSKASLIKIAESMVEKHHVFRLTFFVGKATIPDVVFIRAGFDLCTIY